MPDVPGDMGGPSAPDSLSERRLEERAIRERWPLGPANRTKILQRLVGYLDLETADGALAGPRTVIAAARTLLAADKINLDEQKLDLAREEAALRRKAAEEDLSFDELVAEAEKRAEGYTPDVRPR